MEPEKSPLFALPFSYLLSLPWSVFEISAWNQTSAYDWSYRMTDHTEQISTYNGWLIDHTDHFSIQWLIDWSYRTNFSIEWLIDWSYRPLQHTVVDWLIIPNKLQHRMVDWLIIPTTSAYNGWLIDHADHFTYVGDGVDRVAVLFVRAGWKPVTAGVLLPNTERRGGKHVL